MHTVTIYKSVYFIIFKKSLLFLKLFNFAQLHNNNLGIRQLNKVKVLFLISFLWFSIRFFKCYLLWFFSFLCFLVKTSTAKPLQYGHQRVSYGGGCITEVDFVWVLVSFIPSEGSVIQRCASGEVRLYFTLKPRILINHNYL